MRIQSNRLADKVLKANKTIVVLSTNVQIEHEEGFDKALRQAVYLLEAHTLAADFNISQDVYDGKMMLGLGLPSKDDGATNDGVENDRAADEEGLVDKEDVVDDN